MSPKWLRLWSCVLVLVFPLSLIASDTVGLLSTSGQVLVDGSPAASGRAIFSGDDIRTGDSARAMLTTRAMSIAVGPKSSLRVAPDGLEIADGAVVVTAKDAVLRINGTRVATKSTGKFLATTNNSDLKIVALMGTLEVGEGQQQTTVPATTGVNVGKQGKDKDQAGQNGNPVPKTTSWLTNADIGILVVVAAAVVAGVTLGIVNSKNASPSVP
ncbi:MAG: hypothetical protein ACRD3E_17455 [Terriglobales bacterium]